MMTRQEAERLVGGFGTSLGVKAELTPGGFAGLSVETASLFFEYRDSAQTLDCSALVYRFHDAPRPGVLEGFAAEQAAGTDTGGGRVDYEPANQGLYLSRTYQAAPDAAAFAGDMRSLLKASLRWSDEVLPRVAERVHASPRP
jgi:hypothetical protein